MIAVTNTSPLNYLIQIDAVWILPRLYETVLLPPAVSKELRHSNAPSIVRSYLQSLPGWIEVASSPVTSGLDTLDDGEREAILVAEERGVATVLMDEMKGRRAAESRGLSVIGTLGLLDQAGRRGWMAYEEGLERLMATNFRIRSVVLQRLRKTGGT